MRILMIALAVSLGIGAAQAADKPVVVELFTSQGCSSCPAADAFLGELAKRDDVLALSFHVDYWDYIGWKDPFAQRANTERQRGYTRALNQRYVYTPQIVVNGASQGIGSDRATINKLIDKARTRDAGPSLTVTGSGLQRVVRIGAAGGAPAATVWLIGFDRVHETPIRSGENSGKKLANHNVVRTMSPVGAWQGAASEIPLDLSAIASKNCDSAAVIVQADDMGPVLGAARVSMPGR
jgi:hypothetical protein